MIRKFAALITASVMAVLGLLVSPTAASAAGTFSPAVTITTGAYLNPIIPGTDQFALAFGTTWDSASSTQTLKVFQLKLDGTVANQQVIATGVRTQFDLTNASITGKIGENGIVVSWVQSVELPGNSPGESTQNSSVYSIYTDDGVNWSLPVEVFPVISKTTNDCYMFYYCGYRDLKTVMDSRGVLATSVSVNDGQNISTLLKTSNDGVTWGTTNRVGGNLRYPNIVKIQPLDAGGFMAFFVGDDGTSSNLYVTKTTNSRYAFWSTPVKVLTNNYLSSMELVSKGDGKYDFFYQGMSNNETIINRMTFDSNRNTWSEPQLLANTPNSYLGTRILIAKSGKRVALVYSAAIYNVQESKIMKIEIVDDVAKPVEEVASGTHQNVQVFGLRINGDGSLSFALTGPTFAPKLVEISSTGTITPSPIPMEMDSGYGSGVVSPSGNLFVFLFDFTNNFGKTIAYLAADAPVPTGALVLKGKAVKNAKLVATPPIFTSKTGIGETKFQWYSCSAKVTTLQAAIPAKCVAIPQATSATFKVTAKQKNKYLGIAVTNSNAVGSVLVFSPTTTKAK